MIEVGTDRLELSNTGPGLDHDVCPVEVLARVQLKILKKFNNYTYKGDAG